MMALTRMSYFNLAAMRQLVQRAGSATAIIEHRNELRDIVPDCSQRLIEGLRTIDVVMKRAEAELEYDVAHGIRVLCINDEDYPQRLRECDDAPLALFYKGTANLNARHVICVVGTRHSTVYGQDMIRRFMADMRSLCPDVLVISGLAYGIDIHAHRRALENGYDTAAVLAHGLDNIYPPRHAETARRMTEQGGLVTEFFTQTNADKVNFVRRNRIVAGMSDACVLVESAAKGGGLITARLARDYNRDVFAFPGRVGDAFSEGCNNLIRDNVAALIGGAADFVRAMSWCGDAELAQRREQGIERQLFPDLSADEQRVVGVLQKANDQNINMLTVSTDMAVNRLAAVLFELEMKGVVRAMAGGNYHLLT